MSFIANEADGDGDGDDDDAPEHGVSSKLLDLSDYIYTAEQTIMVNTHSVIIIVHIPLL
jgi:hypothetical protein